MTKQAYTLYLASSSIRRRELLEQLGIEFDVIKPDVDESILHAETAEGYVLRLSELKASKGLAMLALNNIVDDVKPTLESMLDSKSCLVLGADTIVVCNDEILGKPRDKMHAAKTLQMLSGQTHKVLTAVTIMNQQKKMSALSSTLVEFKDITANEIESYWNTKEPVGKAGAYAIQGFGALFVRRIEGSYTGVVGLPLFETSSLLGQFGVAVERLFSDQQKHK